MPPAMPQRQMPAKAQATRPHWLLRKGVACCTGHYGRELLLTRPQYTLMQHRWTSHCAGMPLLRLVALVGRAALCTQRLIHTPLISRLPIFALDWHEPSVNCAFAVDQRQEGRTSWAEMMHEIRSDAASSL